MVRGLTLVDVLGQLNNDSGETIDLSDTEVVNAFISDNETLIVHPAESFGGLATPYPTNLIQDAGPVAYWRMGDTTGAATGLYDSSPFGVKQNATPNGTLTYGNAGGVPGSLAIGFDGSSGYGSAASSPQLAIPGTCTIETWLKANSLSAVQTLISKGSGGEYEIDIGTDGSVTFSFGGTSSTNFLNAATSEVDTVNNALTTTASNGSTGDWGAGSNTTLAQSTTTVYSGAPYSAQLTSGASGTVLMNLQYDNAVTVGTQYCFTCFIYSPVSTTASLELDWRDSSHNYLSFDSNSNQGTQVTLAAGTWTQVVLTTTAPSGTAYVTPLVSMQATAGSQSFYVDALVLSPWKEWAATGNCHAAQSATQAHSGTHSMQLLSTASGTMSATTTNKYTVTPGTTYTAYAWFYTTATGQTAQVAVPVYNSSGTLQTTYTSSSVNLTQNAWTQVSFTFTPTSGQVQAALRPQPVAGAAGQAIYADTMFLGIAGGGSNVSATVCPAGSITAGAWHHLAVVRNNNALTVTGFVDGAQKTVVNYTGSAAATGNAVFLGAKNNGGTASQFFNGLLSEMALYARLLTAGQVANRYAWGTAANATAPGWGNENWGAFQWTNPGSSTSAVYGTDTWGSATYG
jgi:hypothetical protein